MAASLLAALSLLMLIPAASAMARSSAARIGASAGQAISRTVLPVRSKLHGAGSDGDTVAPVPTDGQPASSPTGSTEAETAGAPAQHTITFGAFTDDSPYGGNVDHINALEAQLHRPIGIVNWYQSFGGGDWVSQVQPSVIKAVTDSGRTPLLTWEPWDPSKGADQPQYKLSRIAGGAFDDYLGEWADGLKATGATIYLRPMHEMNGDWYPWGGTVNGNTPADYVAAWRHMHDVFAAHGATNVKWVWSPVPYSSPNTKANALEKYWPGSSYVDVMALDGYNWGAKHPEYGGWQTFAQIFEDAYNRLADLGNEPIWLAEVGCAPEGGDKAAWVKDMWATAKKWTRLQALVWFDQNKEEDWRAGPVASAFAQRR